MCAQNKNSHPFIMVIVLAVGMLCASQFNTRLKVLHFETKKIDALSEVMLKEKAKKVPLPQLILSKDLINKIIKKENDVIALHQLDASNIDNTESDTSSALAHFFFALNETKKHKRKVRIAYFGDSMIEGDLITQDLRDCMQDNFGGAGVGYVPVTSIVSGFRTSITHTFSGWTTYNLVNSAPPNHKLGISGYCFVPNAYSSADTNSANSNSWVRYAPVNRKHIDKFYETKLLYGKSEGNNYVVINGTHYKLDEKNTVNQLVINSDGNCKSINANFQCQTPIDIYGFSMESDSGVFVDNFSFRGNTGMSISKVTQRMYSETNTCLGYDLIVLEYGLNVVSPAVTDFSWYENGMTNTIKHIRESFPGVSILLISVGDKSFRNEGSYETDPSVPLLVSTQKRMAKQNNLAFWSLYDAMGGSGSMVKWVEGDTTFANSDYTHFNGKGAHKVGKLLYSKLMSQYCDYNKKQHHKLDEITEKSFGTVLNK